MGANWFIALPVSVAAWFDALRPPPGVRLFAPEDLHLTVAFLGAVTQECAWLAFEHARNFPLPAMDVRLGAVEALGGRRRPSAYSALLTEGRQEVERALGLTRERMWDAAHARHDARPPLAHVTLARPSRRASVVEVKRATRWATALDLGSPTCRLDSVALYTWSEDRASVLFRRLATLPLSAAEADPSGSGV